MNNYTYSKIISFFLLAVSFQGISHAQEKLSEEDKKEALEWVSKAEESYLSGSALRIQKAVAALTTACGSETAAMSLYMEAMKSRFMTPSSSIARMFDNPRGRMLLMGGRRGGTNSSSNSSNSPSSMFSDWRKQNTGSNAKPGLKKALQLQFKWMLLCLKKADADKREQEMDIGGSVLSILDELVANAKDASEQMGQAGGAAGIVREYLGISDYRAEKMPDSLINVSGIYEQVLLPPYKEKKDLEGFRQMWKRKMSTEIALIAAIASANKDKKAGEQEAANLYLKRQMECEKECYILGDEVQAISNMKKIISSMKSPNDKQQAIKSMKNLLSGKSDEPESRFMRRRDR